MIAGKLLKRMVLLIGLACVVISAATQSDATALQPDLAYDVLFLATPPVRYHSPPPYPVHLFHLDTATGEITQLDITDRPVSRNALSPDGQHLAVIRGERLCLVDQAWRTRFCLPPGTVDPVIAEPDMYYSKIYWSPDSQSFWVPIRDEEHVGVAEISVSDGTTLTELSLERGWGYVADFSPISKNAYIPLFVYNMETQTQLYTPFAVGTLLPDGQRFADPLSGGGEEKEILLLVDLGDEELPFFYDSDWVTWVGLNNTWSDTELARQPNSVLGVEWSHDGRKIVMQLGSVFPPETSEEIFYRCATAVYFLDTQELRIFDTSDSRGADFVWSPDDTALARMLIHETGVPQGLSIVTLDGDIYPISIASFFPPVEDPLEVSNFYTITWLPRGWLDVDAFATRPTEEAAR